MSKAPRKQRLRERIADWLDRLGCGVELVGCFAPALLILVALLWFG